MIQKSTLLAMILLLQSAVMFAMIPNTVVATINTGVNPAGIALIPDNSFAYVANSNNYGVMGATSVSVLNVTNGTVVTTITDSSFNQPSTVTMSRDGKTAYVTNSNGTTISIIDTATNTVTGTINGFDGPSGMVITPTGGVAYVNNYGVGTQSGNGRTVRVVDLATNTIVGAPITVGQAPAALALSPDGAFVYTVNYVNGNPGTGSMSVINIANNMVVDTITGFFGPFAIAITPDGNFAYVTNFGSNNFSPIGAAVSVVDLNTNAVVGTIDVGIQPSGIAITPDGRFAYVTNYNTLYAGPNFTNLTAGQGTVNIIDTRTNMVVPPTIPVDQSPGAIVIASNGEFAYVTNYTSNTVDIIALQSFEIVAKGCKIKHKNSVTNKITWKAFGPSLPVVYYIYRDAGLTDLAATVPATEPLRFLDHNRQKGIHYTYYLIGVNTAGTMSEPVAVMITRKCKHRA